MNTLNMNNNRRASVLREMGLGPIWRMRGTAADAVPESRPGVVENVAAHSAHAAQAQHTHAHTYTHSEDSSFANADTNQTRTAHKTSTETRSEARSSLAQSARTALNTPATSNTSQQPRVALNAAAISQFDWSQLQTAVAECSGCVLCERRKQAVLGVGDKQADWLLVGEGPGAEEDERGEPFVGQAGKLLDNMLAAIGLRRGHNVYIANTVKCRPPNNRTPEADEMAACAPYLHRQIALLQPKIIVALGRPAAQSLLQQDIKISAARGNLHYYEHNGLRIPVVVTYHPAYLLRNLPDKAKAWDDLCLARQTMQTLANDAAPS